MSQTVEWKLDIPQVQLIFDALAQQPYIKVADLIANLQGQTNASLNPAPTVEAPNA